MKFVVTGASGFIGRALVASLLERDRTVRAVVRRRDPAQHDRCETVEVGDLEMGVDWAPTVRGADYVIHLAGRAHLQPKGRLDADAAAFRKVNVSASVELARAAAAAGVKRLVFVSSIGVLGVPGDDKPFDDGSPCRPVDAYAISKLEAEEGLKEVSGRAGLELVIVRPPMVYGHGAPGNLRRLAELIFKGFPLPFPLPPNKRSLIHVQSLVDCLIKCAEIQRAAAERFVVADSEVISTAEIIRCLAEGLGTKPRLIPVPAAFLSACAKAVGKRCLYGKVFGSLTVDAARASKILEWRPTHDVRAGLIEAGASYRGQLRG